MRRVTVSTYLLLSATLGSINKFFFQCTIFSYTLSSFWKCFLLPNSSKIFLAFKYIRNIVVVATVVITGITTVIIVIFSLFFNIGIQVLPVQTDLVMHLYRHQNLNAVFLFYSDVCRFVFYCSVLFFTVSNVLLNRFDWSLFFFVYNNNKHSIRN